ncbi:MAG: ATP-binding protein [Pseudomonadota bacterium]
MRLTIARKIALAVLAIVIVSIGTMAWVTSSNLQRGFIAYLNEMQAQDLDQLRDLLAERYKREGNFEWLRRKPRALREVLDQMKMQIQAEPAGRGHRRPPRHEDDEGPAPRREAGVDGRPPPLDEGGDDRPPPPRGRADDRPDAPPPHARPPQGARDPMGFAARVSIKDADGSVLMGPPEFPPGEERAIIVGGKTVGVMRLQPLRQATGANASATGFLQKQLRDIFILSAFLIGLSVLAALWLARHLLRPVAALRDVTRRIARGDFGARAPLLSRDELAELALHVNEMAQALQDSEQQRRKMLADISHELRTPLTVIRGEIEALLDGIRKADPRALESLHAEVLRLNKLVEDLHQLTLGDAGDLSFQWQELDLAELLRPLLERYRLRADKAGLDLQWTLPDAPVTLEGDSGRLTQVFLNLLENSVRYTDAGGRIAVAMTAGPSGAEVSIDDSAPGVPAGAHASLFERLYRVDSARTRESGGSGLGLAIVKMLVDAHGGSITATASPLGGVRMTVRLPLQH